MSSNWRIARKRPEVPEEVVPPMNWQDAIETMFVVKGMLFTAVPESMIVMSQNRINKIIAFLKEQQQLQLQQHPQDATTPTMTAMDFEKLQETAQRYDDIDASEGNIHRRVETASTLLRTSAVTGHALKRLELESIQELLQEMNDVLMLAMPTIESIIENTMSKLEN